MMVQHDGRIKQKVHLVEGAALVSSDEVANASSLAMRRLCWFWFSQVEADD
jgi:hypothetical protein